MRGQESTGSLHKDLRVPILDSERHRELTSYVSPRGVEHCMHLGDLAQLKQEDTACTLDILLNLLNLLNLLTLSKRTHSMHLVGFSN